MKGFNRWLSEFQAVAPLYAGLDRLTCFRPYEMGGKIALPPLDPAELTAAVPPDWRQRFAAFVGYLIANNRDEGHGHNLVEAWALAGLAADGPKVYRPTRDECLALAQVEMNVPWPLYRQPFDTVAVALPDDLYTAPLSADVGTPVAVVSRLDVARRVVSLAAVGLTADGEAGNHLTGQYVWADGSEQPIESHIGRLTGYYGDLSDDEEAAQVRLIRVAVNACLLLTQYGHRSLGKANPGYAARLEASLRKKGLPESVRRANRAALHALPELIGFDQHVRVYDHAGEPHGGGGERGEVRPHWRRGHWANVACGTGRAERRLVFRRPVLVHADRFAGSPADTRVTLTTAR